MFILVHRANGGAPIDLVPHNIAFMDAGVHGGAVVRFPGGEQLQLRETPDEIKAAVELQFSAVEGVAPVETRADDPAPSQAKGAKKGRPDTAIEGQGE